MEADSNGDNSYLKLISSPHAPVVALRAACSYMPDSARKRLVTAAMSSSSPPNRVSASIRNLRRTAW